jgi:hypothetical protein
VSRTGDIGCMPFLIMGCLGLLLFVFIVGSEPRPGDVVIHRPEDYEEVKRKPVESRNAVANTRELRNLIYNGESVWLCLDQSVWGEMDEAVDRTLLSKSAGAVTLREFKDAGKIKAYPVGTMVRLTASAGPNSWRVTVLDGTNGEAWVRDFQLAEPSFALYARLARQWTAARAYVIALTCAIAILLPLGITVVVRTIRRRHLSVKPTPGRWEL